MNRCQRGLAGMMAGISANLLVAQAAGGADWVFNPGYACSVIGGRDAQHSIQHVRFENFRLDGRPVATPDEMDLYCKQTADITFH